MKHAVAKKWIKALESGDYAQTQGELRDSHNGFCCLGVLCNLHAIDHPELAAQQTDARRYFGQSAQLPEVVILWADVQSSNGKYKNNNSLILLNDEKGYNFHQIAEVIRENWKEL